VNFGAVASRNDKPGDARSRQRGGAARRALAPDQNIENNPMHSSQGCRRDVYGFSEIS
jgi:hypothetical protein